MSDVNLHAASTQWATRPADERFPSLEALYESALQDKQESVVSRVYDRMEHIDLSFRGNELILNAYDPEPMTLNNWAFGQLCSHAGAPQKFMRKLSAAHVSNDLNYIFAKDDFGFTPRLYSRDGVVKGITSEKYTRLHDADILRNMMHLPSEGWAPPPAYDIVDESGESCTDHGLYRGDRDMFVFMVNEENRVDDGSEGGLGRGFFLQNSEVGSSSFRFTDFLYRYICGNHIVWGAQDIREVSFKHIGGSILDRGIQELEATLELYAQTSAAETEATIRLAQEKILGKDKEEVVEFLFKKKWLSRVMADEAYETCVEEEELDPRSVWGMVQGVTSIAKKKPNMNTRLELESVSSKLMAVV